MFNRQVVKQRGKTRFKANYWRAVLVALVYTIATAGGASYTGRTYTEQAEQNTGDALSGVSPGVALAISGALLGVIVICVLIDIFVFNPLEVGCDRFFIENLHNTNAESGIMAFGFKSNFKNIGLAMLTTKFFTFLWTLLLIVPGIIKSYSWRMVPYLLTEDPDMTGSEARIRSQEMMNGNKWAAFVYDLSFIGWLILGACTLGIFNIFYVAPYKCSSDAALYEAIAGKPENVEYTDAKFTTEKNDTVTFE